MLSHKVPAYRLQIDSAPVNNFPATSLAGYPTPPGYAPFGAGGLENYFAA